MNEMSLKEKAALSVVVMLALYAFAVVLWFVNCRAAWDKAAKAYNREKSNYARECKLIGERQFWADEYENEKSQMPTFGYSQTTDTTWLQKMDELAEKNHIAISQRQGGKEVEKGDVHELPIEVKNWEGALESLVRFLYELDNSADGMFDVSNLVFKPGAKKGYLKGSFTLTCAYMREEESL